MRIGLGLDTGGTFTDAVVMDLDEGKVLCKAKSPTTREDLCIGIRKAIGLMDPGYLGSVGVVSLSSTLATNSIVEGKGARVALVCIGCDYESPYPADFQARISGQHDLKGAETEPLDEKAAEDFLRSVEGRVDGVAIAGYLAVRNPEHEDRVRDIVGEVLGVPAVCGHDLSSGLGFSERAATCVMNARLIPVIADLMESVKKVMAEYGLNAPLMMVRGDGSMMGEAEAKRKPVETVMSGPAASLIGAMRMTGMKDAIVMDMGGTTTDIGILRYGKPRLEPEGATIGGIRTRVMAAEISTSGIGGDSRILVLGRDIRLASLRVCPICFAARQWPSVAEAISELEGKAPRMLAMQNEDTVVLGSELFRTLRIPKNGRDFSPLELRLLDALSGEPMTLEKAGEALGAHPFTLGVRRLEGLGLIQRIGFTPTDVLHASGDYIEYDADASAIAAGYLARGAGMDTAEFLAACKDLIKTKLCTELMKELLSEETGSMDLGKAGADILAKSISGKAGRDYACSIRVTKPIIGIGAPVRAYMPWVGEVFGTEVMIHEDSDVGNAIGAISSSVSETVTVLVRPESIGSEKRFQGFSKLGKFDYDGLGEALEDSERRAREYVARTVADGGAEDVTVTCERKDRMFRFGDTGQECLMEVELSVTAAGRPRPFSSQ